MLLDHAATVKVLQAAVKGLPARDLDRLEVTVTAVDNQPELCVAGYRVPLDNTVTVDAFPGLPPAAPGGHTVGRDDFTTLVTRVAVAADKDGSLPLLTGIRPPGKRGRRPPVTTPWGGHRANRALTAAPEGSWRVRGSEADPQGA